MHGADPAAHDQGTKSQLQNRQFRLADQPQGKPAGQDRNQQRQRSNRDVVAQLDRQLEREHADEVHRPHADPHRQCAARRPEMHCTPTGGGNAPGQIERRIRRQNRHAQRNQNQSEGIITDEHVDSRDQSCRAAAVLGRANAAIVLIAQKNALTK